MIAAVMLYLCMVLIGRRHWIRSESWHVLGFHFIVRAVALGAMAVGAVYFLGNHPVRLDATSEHLSTLSPHTDEVIDGLRKAYQTAEVKRPVRIEAFVSTKVPETYLQTRLNLLTTLRELKARAGDMMEVQINDTERTGPMADLAKQRYGISPKRVPNIVHGTYSPDQIFMSVAVTCGLERVVLPFIDRGTPVEYELVRAICTVEKQKRKRIGVVETDAPVFGRFSMQGQSPAWQLINDLKRQYEVIQVNPAQPIPLRKPAAKPGEKEEGFDVLLAVQPSAMGPQECENLIAAIRAGQPTVLFEDPFPFFAPDVPGTSQPRRPAGPRCSHVHAAAEHAKGQPQAALGNAGHRLQRQRERRRVPADSRRGRDARRGRPDRFPELQPLSQAVRLPARVRLRRQCLRRQGVRPVQREGPHHFRACSICSSPRRGISRSGIRPSCWTATSSRWCARAPRAGPSALRR